MDHTFSATAPPFASLRHLPVNLFASVMSLSGLAMAWRLAVPAFGAPDFVGDAVGALAVLTFVVLGVAYLAKLWWHPGAVRAEFTHPVAGNFFGTVAISLLLLSGVVQPWFAAGAESLWSVGAAATFVFGGVIVTRLLRGNTPAALAVPAWLIPGVATLDVVVTGTAMPMPWAGEVNLAAAAIGAVLAVLMLCAIFARLVFEAPLAAGLKPSLMILVAPFAVGFLAYTHLTGSVDRFAGVLFYAALFFFAIAAIQVFRRDVPFVPGWWAIGFPIAALANAALVYADARATAPLHVLSAALLAVLTVAVVVLSWRTVRFAANGRLLAGA